MATSYRVYATATIADPTSPETQEAYSLIALLAALEASLGIITACLPMLRPVACTVWSSLPKSAKSKISAMTSSAGSKITRASHMLTLGSLGPRSIHVTWLSGNAHPSERQGSFDSSERAPESVPEKALEEEDVQTIKTGQIHVHRDVDVESAFSIYSEEANIFGFWRDSIRK